jgi:copper(I)-binding protein
MRGFWPVAAGRVRRARVLTRAAGTALAAVAVACLAGCAAPAGASVPIELSTAYVPVPQTPGTTVAYLVIQNNGPADRLVSARTSAGGQITFRQATGPGAAAVRTVASVPIAAHTTMAMAPDSYHMVITGVGPLHGGKDVTLTLVFARAGPVSVIAQVTNPQSGGSSYFLN